VREAPFGHAPDGTAVSLYTFSNAGGVEVRVATYGGVIVCLRIPDREGRLDDVVLGHDDVDGYVRSASYFGALIGRYGNRIARGRFTLDGVTHQLVTNDRKNHQHGGARGSSGAQSPLSAVAAAGWCFVMQAPTVRKAIRAR
jgi:aldose 1-epimerase